MISRIVNARLLDREGLWTVSLAEGRIAGIEQQAARVTAGGGDALDAGGGLCVSALVDSHLHLDLAYSLPMLTAQGRVNQSGTLLEAIGLWAEAKAEISAENVRERAERGIRAEVGFGTGYIRTHVDVGSSAELRLCDGVLAAREATRDLCDVQVVAFPQDGLVRDPQAVDNVREALKRGVDVVGGIPHVERVPRDGFKHLEIVFDLAAEFDADIDTHIDETDDPQSMYVEHLAAMTIERGWQGRVTASHVCALASYDDVHASKVIDLLAEARISVVTNPGVNLHLQGRFDNYPKRRGLTRVRELLTRGITCGAGQDCIADPFYPLGNGRMLDQAFLLVHADHLNAPRQMRQAFDMVCESAGRLTKQNPAGAADGAPAGVTIGAPANLAVFPLETIEELIRMRPDPRAVLHAGRVVAEHGRSV